MGAYSFSRIFGEFLCRVNNQEAISLRYNTDGWVLIYVEARDGAPMYYVGNPLSQEWFQIPLSPLLYRQDLVKLWRYDSFNDIGLVTKIHSGVVVSYKVVWMITRDATKVDFAIYSSDIHKLIALNEILLWDSNINSSFVAYDFYGGHAAAADGCCAVYFPDSGQDYDIPRFRRTITTSEGSILYINEFRENDD
ncbi:PREDICTED: putative F-box protein At3g23950 [Camelina sativa]|uniref:F-box protein At3g23950 n=1 Tax=Camelina sativa TaxID=90675 RepID=A0ABM0TCZ4_CAMSA|nr:PREDICTED: putative F-box protein At3g23950 [Camelina sativa]